MCAKSLFCVFLAREGHAHDDILFNCNGPTLFVGDPGRGLPERNARAHNGECGHSARRCDDASGVSRRGSVCLEFGVRKTEEHDNAAVRRTHVPVLNWMRLAVACCMPSRDTNEYA